MSGTCFDVNQERAGLAATLIWHEAPNRLAATLADVAEAFGARPAAVARELSKRSEEVRRDTLPALALHYQERPGRGEIVVLVGPAPTEAPTKPSLTRLTEALANSSVRDAANLVATATGLPRKFVYARALALQHHRHSGRRAGIHRPA